jgi:hypothetical protein
VTGCETTAFLSRIVKDISAVSSPGVLPLACEESRAERDLRLRFVALDTRSEFIEPGTDLAGFQVRLNDTFGVSNISVVRNSAEIYPTPDVLCTTDAECDAAGLNDSFAAGEQRFVCRRLDRQPQGAPNADIVPRVCSKEIALSVNTGRNLEFLPRLRADDNGRRLVIVQLSGSNQMNGYPFEPGGSFIQDLQPDRLSERTVGLRQMISEMQNWQAPENSRFSNRLQTEVGIYRGSVSYSAGVREGRPFRFFAVDQGRTLDQALSSIDQWIQRDQTQRGNGNPLAAIRDGIRQFTEPEGGREPLPGDRHLVILVDGDVGLDLRGDNAGFGITRDSVLAEAVEAGVALHVIHLDSNTVGRIPLGGLTDYSHMACVTGGSFQYVNKAADLRQAMRTIGQSIPGSFEVTLGMDGLGQLPDGIYSLAFGYEVTMSSVTVTGNFLGYAGGQGAQASLDSRTEFRYARPACSTEEACLLTRTCESGRCVPYSDYPRCPVGQTLTSTGCTPSDRPAPDTEPTPEPDEGEAPGEGSGT